MAISAMDNYSIAFNSYVILLIVQAIVYNLQRSGYGLCARIFLVVSVPLLILVPPYIFAATYHESNVEYFYALLAGGILPILLFNTQNDIKWLFAGLIYNLIFIISYDTFLGFKSTPTHDFAILDNAFFRFKIRQLMVYFIVICGYMVKIRLNQFFEERLESVNVELAQKNHKIQTVVGTVQAQNEELQAQQEEMKAKNEELSRNRNELNERNTRIEKYLQVQLALAKSSGIKKGDFKAAIEEICILGTNALEIARVSIWEFDRKRKSLICSNLFERGKNINSSGYEFFEADYAPFFDAMCKEEVIIANDAFSNPATSVFMDGYNKQQLDVRSMLDAPYFINGDLGGVVVALAHESSERKKIETRLRLQKEEILAKNEELLQQQEEIQSINESLELKVKDRTRSLEKKNTQLQEYTYVNSHLLRGPLCRILGIIYLLEHRLVAGAEIDFLVHLKESASELDGMVKKITRNLESDDPTDTEALVNTNNIKF